MNARSRKKLSAWFDERLPFAWLRTTLAEKTVPRHQHSFWYYFGGLTLFFFCIQVVTGILLSLYYQPSPEHAHESVAEIVNQVPQGWLIRSVHSWSANLMVGMLFIHMFSAFLMKAYRKPRELIWISGVLLLFLVLGFGFTGYLLPWDTTGYFATLIGTEVPQSIPIVGTWGVSLLKGAEEIGESTLTRMYSIHVIILPLIALLITSFHVLANQYSGSSVPVTGRIKGPPIKFFPNFLYRDFLAWIAGFGVLLVLSTVLPRGLGDKANPMASAPPGIRPEWYFLPLYQTLRMVPAQVFAVDGELVVNGMVLLVTLFWMAIPFIDRRSTRGAKSPVFTAIGIMLIIYLGGCIALAFLY